MNLFTFVAEITTEHPALYTYGPLGVFCSWLMWRDGKNAEARKAEDLAYNKEIANLAHRIDGLGKAIWAGLIESNSGQTARLARDELAKFDSRVSKD